MALQHIPAGEVGAASWIVSVELKPRDRVRPNAAWKTKLSELPEAVAVAPVITKRVGIAGDRGLRTVQIKKAIRAITLSALPPVSISVAALPEPVDANVSPPP